MPDPEEVKLVASRAVRPGLPAMSVVVVTSDNFHTIRKTVSHLAAQSARANLELVLVAPAREALGLDESLLSVFGRLTIVEEPAFASIGRANAAGIRSAAAPVVALAEDHCFPDPDWAEQLIEAHRGPWAAVGPSVRNANPATAVSWADFLIGYGPWSAPARSREMEFLPGHNSSYKRDVLLEYGDRLEEMMDTETLLHWDLRRRGHRLYLEASACVAHTNFSRWSSWLPVQFYCGRLFAGQRALEMTRPRRLLYIGGAPLIPLVRLWRILRGCGDAALRHWWSLPALAIGLAIDGAGQLAGYAAGCGNALQRTALFEFKRIDHVRPADRALFAEDAAPAPSPSEP